MSCALRTVVHNSRRHVSRSWIQWKRLHHLVSNNVCQQDLILKPHANLGKQMCVSRTGRSKCRSSRSLSSMTINNKTICEVAGENADTFLAMYDTILLDCDGVLWEVDHVTPIPDIPQTMNKLREIGKQIIFVTNNSIPGRDTFVDKFQDYGFSGSFDEVFTVSYAAAVYLKNVAKIKRSVFAIGTPGMEFELKQMGLKYYGFGPSIEEPTRDNEKLLSMKFHNDVDAVLVGFDEYYGYVKLYKAASYLTHESCLFVATTNLGGGEKFSPTRRQPITAAIVDSVTVAAKREPILMNKPHAHMYNCIKAKYPSVDKSRTLFIGDSVNADIGFAKTVGIDSALVLTGSSSLATLENYPGLEPDFLLKSLAVLGPPI